MANRVPVQANRGVHNRRGAIGVVFHVAHICRKPLIAYVAIAFAISLGFHEIGNHTDRELAKSLKAGCLQTNMVRRQVNSELIKLNKGKVHLTYKIQPLALNDCSIIPSP